MNDKNYQNGNQNNDEKKIENIKKMTGPTQDITMDLNVYTGEGLLNRSNIEMRFNHNKSNLLENKHDISELPKPRFFH